MSTGKRRSEGPQEKRLQCSMSKKVKKDDADIQEIILQKIVDNALLTGKDRSYIFEFVRKHQNCSLENPSPGSSSPANSKVNGSTEEKTVKNVSVQTEGEKTVVIVNSHKYAKNFLITEWPKPEDERNTESCERAIEELFEERRNLILGPTPPSIPFMFECHPYLFDLDQGRKEFERIIKRDDLFPVFKKNAQLFSTVLLDVIPPSPIKKKIMGKINSAGSKKRKAFMEVAGSLIMLPKYLGEDRKNCILFEEEPHDDENLLPYIKCNCSLTEFLDKKAPLEIYIENVKFCEPKSPLQAFFMLLASYFIFNIEYQSNINETMTVLQVFYAKIKGLGEFMEPESSDKMMFLLKRLKQVEPDNSDDDQ